jgi:hypothetical protein
MPWIGVTEGASAANKDDIAHAVIAKITHAVHELEWENAR